MRWNCIADPVARFWSYVNKSDDPDGCWRWTGRPMKSGGYGRFCIGPKGRTVRAHRWAYEQASGEPVPDGFEVCHDCPPGDTPACVRNDPPGFKEVNGIFRPKYGHLFLGTHAENMADMSAKGRGGIIHLNDLSLARQGEGNPGSKLTNAIVMEIRARALSGERQAHLAREYGISPGALNGIVNRKRWSHI